MRKEKIIFIVRVNGKIVMKSNDKAAALAYSKEVNGTLHKIIITVKEYEYIDDGVWA